jgi:hypothetical protein
MKKIYYFEQIKFLKENKLKLGDEVRILYNAESFENGWGQSWDCGMNDWIGKTAKIHYISNHSGIMLKLSDDNPYHHYYFPFFVLEKAEPEFEKRPFYTSIDVMVSLERI